MLQALLPLNFSVLITGPLETSSIANDPSSSLSLELVMIYISTQAVPKIQPLILDLVYNDFGIGVVGLLLAERLFSSNTVQFSVFFEFPPFAVQ